MTGINELKQQIEACDKAQKNAANAAFKAWRSAVTTAERLRDLSAPLQGDALTAALVGLAETGVKKRLSVKDADLYSSTLAHFASLVSEDAPNKRLSLQGTYIAGQVLNQTHGMTAEQRHDVMSAVIGAFWGNVRTGLLNFDGSLWHKGMSRQTLEVWAETLCPELLAEQRHDEMASRGAYAFALNSLNALAPASPKLYTVKRSDDEKIYVRNNKGGSVGVGQITFKGNDVTALTPIQFAEVSQHPGYTNQVASGNLCVVTPEDAAVLIEEGE